MTFRQMIREIGIALGLTLLAGACAEARPLVDASGDARGAGALVSRAGGYELEVLVDGVPAPTFFQNGETYVMGALGARYTLRIVNRTGRRIEAVASVDGRDVVDGKPADFRSKRGYLVPAWGAVDVDGWRLSRAQVAAFRFSSVADSYAARTGSAREVGVIGAAIFPERYVPRPRPLELPYTDPRASAPEPYRYRGDADGYAAEGGAGDRRAESAPAKRADDAGAARSAAPSAEAAAPSAAPAPYGSGGGERHAEAARPGLGTEFGEAVGSSVREVTFMRANPTSPAVVLGARYNDHDGLVALGIDVDPDTCGNGWACDRDLELRQSANPFPVTDRRFAPPPPCWNGRSCR